MLRLNYKKHGTRDVRQAQTLVEYGIIIGIIGLVLMAMGPMIMRGFQSMIKITADQVGNQANSEQNFNAEKDGGATELMESSIQSRLRETTSELVGNRVYFYDDTSKSRSVTVTNLGFTASSGE